MTARRKSFANGNQPDPAALGFPGAAPVTSWTASGVLPDPLYSGR
jgi:hypothetical protein